MAKLPYYPFYVDDFDQDDKVRDMEFSEIGLYILCLNEAWRAGSLPDDFEQVAIDIRRKPSKVEVLWGKVRACFVLNEAGRLVNPKQEKVRAEVEKRSQSAKHSAELGWEKRRKQKETGDVVPTSIPVSGDVLPTSGAPVDANAFYSDANAQKNGCESYARAFGLVCVSPSLSVSVKSEKSELAFQCNPRRFVGEYPLEVNDWVVQCYLSLVASKSDEDLLFENLALYRQTEQWQRGMIPSAENFIRKGIWKVKPKAPPVKSAAARSKLAASLEGIMTGRQG